MAFSDIIAGLVNHLWQSTAVAAIAWLLAMALRQNQARARFWIWFAASMKFLFPLSLLIAVGDRLRAWISVPVARSEVTHVVEQVTQPFGMIQDFSVAGPVEAHRIQWWFWILLAIWGCGALIAALRSGLAWWKVFGAKRAARPLKIAADIPVLLSPVLIEPGVFGIIHPVLLLPEGILERLSAEQMGAILAHEMCHVRRRDNFTYAIHMLVETLFWFDPAVWWIGARLIEERERACDEAVVEAGGAAETYAEGILNVCKFYIDSPMACVAGVTGADLKKRVAWIMAGQFRRNLSMGRKLMLGMAMTALLAAPVADGLVNAFHLRAQLLFAKDSSPSFEVATIKPSQNSAGPINFRLTQTRFRVENASLKELIRFAYEVKSDDQLAREPDWMSSEKFDIDAKVGDSQVAAMKKLLPDQRFDQYRLMVQSLLADRFKLRVSTVAKEVPVLALVAAKNGPKLTETSASSGTPVQHMPLLYGGSKGDLTAEAVSMKFFTDFFLSGKPDWGGRMVIDATGLKGSYDFTLKWSPSDKVSAVTGADSQSEGAAGATTEASGPSLIAALQEQLGMKLEPRKAPIEVLVIDHVEQPSPN